MTGNLFGLPDATPQSPACGCCSGDTEDCGEYVACYDCQLSFDTDTLAAVFLNPDAPVCGASCDNYWHGDDRIYSGMAFRCGTCRLPDGHDSFHWTGCEAVTHG